MLNNSDNQEGHEEHPPVKFLDMVADRVSFPEKQETEAHIKICDACRFAVCVSEASSTNTAASPLWKI